MLLFSFSFPLFPFFYPGLYLETKLWLPKHVTWPHYLDYILIFVYELKFAVLFSTRVAIFFILKISQGCQCHCFIFHFPASTFSPEGQWDTSDHVYRKHNKDILFVNFHIFLLSFIWSISYLIFNLSLVKILLPLVEGY